MIAEVVRFVGIIAIIGLLYLAGLSLIDHYHQTVATNSTPVVVQQTEGPNSQSAVIADEVTRAVKSAELASALANQAIQLSQSQAQIGKVIEIPGASPAFDDAIISGLTKAPPKVQVIKVATGAQSHLVAAPIKLSDDEIQRDLKSVINDPDTKIKTDVTSHVDISYADKPEGPIFAAYSLDGTGGAGVTIHRTKLFNIDALLLKGTVTTGIQSGIGIEHEFKGTSLGVGLDEQYSFATHKVAPSLFVGVHI